MFVSILKAFTFCILTFNNISVGFNYLCLSCNALLLCKLMAALQALIHKGGTF